MIAEALPVEFLDKCTATERAEVEAWWTGLADRWQSDVSILLDRRQESCAYVHCLDGNGDRVWRTLPIVDEDLPFDDPQDDVREWQLDYFQYLLDHPELVLAPDAVIRTFHICVDHPTARKVAAEGRVDCSFCCPADSADCPIQEFATKIQQAVLIERDRSTNRTTWLCR